MTYQRNETPEPMASATIQQSLTVAEALVPEPFATIPCAAAISASSGKGEA